MQSSILKTTDVVGQDTMVRKPFLSWLSSIVWGNPIVPISPEILAVYRKFYDFLESAEIVNSWKNDQMPTHMQEKKRLLPRNAHCPFCPGTIVWWRIFSSMIDEKKNLLGRPFVSDFWYNSCSLGAVEYRNCERSLLVGICACGHSVASMKKYDRVIEAYARYDFNLSE